MNKNSFADVVKIIADGTDREAITEIGKKYPMLLHAVTKVVTKAGEDFVSLMEKMPDTLTVNKVNAAFKADAACDVEAEQQEDKAAEKAPAEEQPKAKRGRKPKAEEKKEEVEEVEEENPYSEKSAMELYKECKSRGLKVEPKKPSKFYADILMKDDKEKEAQSDDDDWGEDEVESKQSDDDDDWDI